MHDTLTIDQIDRLLVESLPLDIAATLRGMRRHLERDQHRPLVVHAQPHHQTEDDEGNPIWTYLLIIGPQDGPLRFMLRRGDDELVAPLRILAAMAHRLDAGKSVIDLRVVDIAPGEPSGRNTIRRWFQGRQDARTHGSRIGPLQRHLPAATWRALEPIALSITPRDGAVKYERRAGHSRLTARMA